MWRRWHTPQNFFLVFIDERDKKLLKWGNKKLSNFNNYNIALFKKTEEKHLEILF